MAKRIFHKIVAMKAMSIPINWNSGLPVFASESFLKAVGDEYGWIGGIDDSGKLRCILPYTVIRKAIFRMVRFRVETIPVGGELDIQEEKNFLNSAIEYFRSIGADMIIPATTNTIFRTYPDGAIAAPYGSYRIDLSQPEDVLWRNINTTMRQDINTAIRKGVSIRGGIEHLDEAYMLIRGTFKRSKMPFMSYESFKRYMLGLGENGRIMVAGYNGVAESSIIFAFSDYCVYAVYAGNIANQRQGVNKLLYWEAIRLFKKLGVKSFDFVGARIDPEKGSRQDGINLFKRHFGSNLILGYMWKYPIHPLKYSFYCLAARLRTGGDVVDQESHKMKTPESLLC
ncbi:MAG: hypothetical protein PHV48_00195 [Candidatus Omnitrophica bacterium]|nr:hypothetical protein [Candidatus Omnitrophota bacterium]